MKRQAILPSVIFVVGLYCWATPAGADPIVVTSGHVFEGFGPSGEPGIADALRLEGGGLRIASSLEDEDAFTELVTPPNWTPGTLVDLSGVLRVGDTIGGRLNDLDGVVAAPFNLFFDVSPTQVVCSADGSLPRCSAVAPFTFHAELTFIPFGGIAATHHLIGRGTAVAGATPFQGGAVDYIFEPVPEPATLSLVTTRALIAAGGVWRRRRADRRPE